MAGAWGCPPDTPPPLFWGVGLADPGEVFFISLLLVCSGRRLARKEPHETTMDMPQLESLAESEQGHLGLVGSKRDLFSDSARFTVWWL